MSEREDVGPNLARDVARLLSAQGHEALGSLVEVAHFEASGGDEAWELDGRKVVAREIAMRVTPESFAKLSEDDEALGRVREAVRAVVRSTSTELSRLILLVERGPLEGIAPSTYRSPPRAARSEPGALEVVEICEALSVAFDKTDLAELFSRAELEVAALGDSDLPLRRWVVRLPAGDVARLDRDPELRAAVERIVRYAATSASVRVAEVDIAPRRREV